MVQLQEINDETAERLEKERREGLSSTSQGAGQQTTTAAHTQTQTQTSKSSQNGRPGTDNNTSTSIPTPPAQGPAAPDLADAMMSAFPQMSAARAAFGGGGGDSKKKTVDEVAAELKKSPFFMTELEENDETEAFKALAYEGTPLENATEFKTQGNECFKVKRWFDAKEHYTKGVLILAAEERKRAKKPGEDEGEKGEQWTLSEDERKQAVDEKWPEADDQEKLAEVTIRKQRALLEQLYGNRAACHLELKNYRSCWLDGAAALRLNDGNIKAYYRSARAFLAVGRIEEADDACARGLEIDPGNASLKAVAREIIKKNEEVTAKARKDAEREAKEKRRALLLKAALKARNIPTRETAQPPEMEDAKVELVPDPDDPRSSLSFPTVLLYPVHLQSDFIKAFNEQQSVGDHLEYILPLPWDEKGEYTLAGVECYMETTAGGLIKVGKKLPLLKILSSGKVEVVDEVVRIFVVPKGEADAWVAEFKSKKAAERGGS